MGRTAALIALALALAGAPRIARAEDPSDARLFWTGVALAPPTYMVGVTLHEGSHAIAAKLVGGTIDLVHLFPPGIDPHVHTFRFGWVYARGLDTRGKKIFFYLAPKITDALFLSTFTALYFTDSLPDRGYGLLALTVGATGFWVDFAKDVVLFSPNNDVVKAFHGWCMYGAKQIAPRLLYAAISAGFSYAIVRGYQRTFHDTESRTGAPREAAMRTVALPLLSASF